MEGHGHPKDGEDDSLVLGVDEDLEHPDLGLLGQVTGRLVGDGRLLLLDLGLLVAALLDPPKGLLVHLVHQLFLVLLPLLLSRVLVSGKYQSG